MIIIYILYKKHFEFFLKVPLTNGFQQPAWGQHLPNSHTIKTLTGEVSETEYLVTVARIKGWVLLDSRFLTLMC